jgi:hypothetical protein
VEPVQLWGSGTLSKAATITAQRRVNVYFEIRPDGDKANVVVVGRPGLTNRLTLSPTPNGPIRGVHEGENYAYIVAGDTLYRVTADLLTQTTFTGVILSTSGNVSMADNGTQLAFVDGTAGYLLTGFDTSSSTLAVISDSDFPDGARTITCLTGRFVVDNPGYPGRFNISDSYDGTAWSGTNFATAEQASDNLAAVDTYRGHLVPFGTKTLEAWQPIGALDFPFAPVTSATQNWGLAAPFSRAKLDNMLYFLGQNAQGQVQVMRINGWGVERASDSDVENAINAYATKSDAVALSYLLDGHPMYQITFPSANKTWRFDASTQIWSEDSTGPTATGRHIGQHSLVINGKTYITDYRQSNPEVYELDSSAYSDDGAVIKRIVATRHLTRGGNRFTIDALRLEMETGVGLETGQGSDPQLMVEVSRDGGRSYSPEQWIDIGALGEYLTRVEVRRCGSAEDFVFRFSMTDPVKFCIARGTWKVHGRAQ